MQQRSEREREREKREREREGREEGRLCCSKKNRMQRKKERSVSEGGGHPTRAVEAPGLAATPHTVLALALRCPSPKPAPVQSATQVAVHSVQVQSKCSAEAQHSVLSARSATSTEC